MFAQHAHSASHRRIEIDVQVADKIVGHALKSTLVNFSGQGGGLRGYFALGSGPSTSLRFAQDDTANMR